MVSSYVIPTFALAKHKITSYTNLIQFYVELSLIFHP